MLLIDMVNTFFLPAYRFLSFTTLEVANGTSFWCIFGRSASVYGQNCELDQNQSATRFSLKGSAPDEALSCRPVFGAIDAKMTCTGKRTPPAASGHHFSTARFVIRSK